jgi:hypothetical protein
MNDLLNLILDNPQNGKVLQFLKLENNNDLIRSFRTWKNSYSGFDEGGCLFFDKYGEYISDSNKFSLDIHSVMINENTGEIFAFNTGRFSVFFKCNFERAKVQNSDKLRKGYTFDCITDISELGDNWCFMDCFSNQKEQLKWAYELTKNNEQPT